MLIAGMLKIRTKRRAEEGFRVAIRLARIEASITGLQDEDLLDLADIFKSQADSPLFQITCDEMRKRNISL